MSNRQTFPNALYPIAGDVESQTGSPDVTVTGIQNTPFAADAPQPGQIPVMNTDGSWHPEDPVVSGTDASGTPSSKNPVQIAGIDDGNLVRELRTDTYGSVRAQAIEELLLWNLAATRALLAAFIEANGLAETDYELTNFITR